MEAKICSQTDLNHRLVRLSLEPLGEYSFQAGQYAVLSAPMRNTDIKGYYSIASSSRSTEKVDFLIRTGDGSKASELFGSLSQGETVEISAPSGQATFQKPNGEKSVFVSSGTGFAPHLSILLSHAEEFDGSPVQVLCGILSRKDRFAEESIEELKRKIKNFSFEWVYSREDQDSGKPPIMIADYFSKIELNKSNFVYSCGQPEMVEATEKLALEKGIMESRFIKERY